MAYLERDGVRIFYEASTARNGRTPVLLSHGFGSSSRMWAPNVPALADERQVITWDMRGHGRSDYPDDPGAYSRQASVADMAALLDASQAPAAVIGGLSLGGYFSLAFYLAHPDRVAALILCDTGPGFRNAVARQEWNGRAMAQAERLEREGLTAFGPHDAAQHRNADGVARAARGMLTQADGSVIELLPSIAVPTLVIVGAGDKAFLGAASYMKAKIPDATQVVIPDAGHVANTDQPDLFNREVLAFLGELH